MWNLEEDKKQLKSQLKSSVIVSETLAADVGRLRDEIARLKAMLTQACIAHCPHCRDVLFAYGNVTKAYKQLTAVCPASTKRMDPQYTLIRYPSDY